MHSCFLRTEPYVTGGLAYDSTIARAGRFDATSMVPPKGSPGAKSALALTARFLGRTSDGQPLDFHVAPASRTELHVPARAAGLRPDANPGHRAQLHTILHGINTD
jgi:hypothetical protein